MAINHNGHDLYILHDAVETRNDRHIAFPTGFFPTLHEYRLDLLQGIKTGANVFVCSMADLFGDWIPDEWIQKVFEACRKTPQHQYLFLTKNPERYDQYGWCLETDPNFWFGATVTNNNDFSNLFYSETSVMLSYLSIEPLQEEIFIRLERYLRYVKWIIIGAETGNQKNKIVPKASWVRNIVAAANVWGIPVFMKDSLIPIVGEENMRREFPAALQKKS
jgi:protein gp37